MDSILKEELQNAVLNRFQTNAEPISKMISRVDLDDDEKARLLDLIEDAELGEDE